MLPLFESNRLPPWNLYAFHVRPLYPILSFISYFKTIIQRVCSKLRNMQSEQVANVTTVETELT